MGTIRSAIDLTGLVINGVTLGSPSGDLDDSGEVVGPFRWDDARFPSGELDAVGVLTVDEEDVL